MIVFTNRKSLCGTWYTLKKNVTHDATTIHTSSSYLENCTGCKRTTFLRVASTSNQGFSQTGTRSKTDFSNHDSVVRSRTSLRNQYECSIINDKSEKQKINKNKNKRTNWSRQQVDTHNSDQWL